MSNKRIFVRPEYNTPPNRHTPYEIDFEYVKRNYFSSYEDSIKSFDNLKFKNNESDKIQGESIGEA